MPQNLTLVILQKMEGKHRYELLFGVPLITRECTDVTQVLFGPGQVFGLELWEANDYGTVLWQIFIVRAISPTEKGMTIPQVSPGGEILLSARGRDKVRRVRAWLLCLNRPLHLLDPDYYRAAHFRLKIGLTPRELRAPFGKLRDLLKTGSTRRR